MIRPFFRLIVLALLPCFLVHPAVAETTRTDIQGHQDPASRHGHQDPQGHQSPQSPYDQEVAARRQRFEREARLHSPAAVVPLLGLLDLWELADDRAAIVALAETAEKEPAVSPDVRAYARWLLRELARRRGDGEAAARLSRALGLLRSFSIVGPFDNEGRRGHATAYPPEKELVAAGPDTLYEGKNRVVPPRWRVVPEEDVGKDGSLALDAFLRPDTAATAYAACYVRNERPAPLPIALRAGSTGAIKVWVNRGATVIDHDVTHPLRLDQEVGGATLLPGWNRILVKISGGEGPWAFLLRITAPDGKPLALSVSAEPPEPGWAIPAASAAKVAASSLLLKLRAAVVGKRGAARGQALTDLGIYVHHQVPGDPDERDAETLLGQAADELKSPRAYRLLAVATADSNDKRKALEAGIALPNPSKDAQRDGFGPSERARLTVELGRLYEEGRRERLADQAYAEAERLDPGLYTARLHEAQLASSRGMAAEAERLAGPVAREHPALRAQRALAALLAQRGKQEQADRLYQHILAESHDDNEAIRHFFEECRSRGDLEGALQWQARLRAVRPEAIWLARERAELLEGGGRDAEALSLVDGAIGQMPGEPELHQLRGRLLLRLGRIDSALSAYHRALELRPQNPELRAYLAHLDPTAHSGDDLARAFRVDVKDLPRPQVAQRSGDPARVLLDQSVTRVHDNGLSEVFTQRVVEILDERGARESGDFEVRFTPDTQSVQIKTARVYKKDGEVQEIAAQGERDVSEPWYGLYYDVRAQTLRFDGLAPGDVIDVEYVVADVGRRNLLADYFGDMHFFQEDIPRVDTRYTLVLPKALGGQGRRLYFNTPRTEGFVLEHSERVDDQGQQIYTYRAKDVPKLESEPGMPGYSELAAYLHVSTYKSWEDVATWYRGLVQEQLQPSAEITRAARAAVVGIKDERQKIRAVYDLVVKRTRYVGLEFGIHGYKPYKVAQIFNRKFGDCKDKASLLKVMLHEVGVDASLVLARTRRNGGLAPEPASLSAFDHAIVYVPKYDLFLDGTAEFSGSDELPADDQDIPVLIVADSRAPYDGQGHLARTPVLAAEGNTVSRQLDVQLHADGGATVRDQMHISGQVAAKWREHYQAPGTQKERYEKAWNELVPGAKVVRVDLPSIGDLERPVTLRGELEVPAWGQKVTAAAQEAGEAPRQAPQQVIALAGAVSRPRQDLVLRPLGREPDLLRNFARLSQRRYDLVLGFPWRNVEKVSVHLPAGEVVRRMPESRRIDSPFGYFVMKVERKGQEVVTQAELEVNRHRISSADYPAFRRFCAEADALVAQELVVGRD